MAKEEAITMTGYYRVSTKKEAQESSFYKYQPAYFSALLKKPKFKNYKPYEPFYCDYGVSGTKLDRPGFKKMFVLQAKPKTTQEVEHPNLSLCLSLNPQQKHPH